jgi:hypothetical protein
MAEQPEVKVGQVWADNDKRCKGRTIRVDAIEAGKAVCTVLTNADAVQAALDAGDPMWVADGRKRPTRISLGRFRPTSTGYRLINEVTAKANREAPTSRTITEEGQQ